MNHGKILRSLFFVLVVIAAGWFVYTYFPLTGKAGNKKVAEAVQKLEEAFGKGDFDKTREYADLITEKSKSAEEKALALYYKGKSYQQSAPEKAAEYWRTVIDKYSDTKVASKARESLLQPSQGGAPVPPKSDTGKTETGKTEPVKSEPADGAKPEPPKEAVALSGVKKTETSEAHTGTIEALKIIAQAEKPGGNTKEIRSELTRLFGAESVPGLKRQIAEALSTLNREALFEPSQNEFHTLYKVNPGDVPLRIGEKCDSTYYLLEVINPRMGVLQVGQNLIVPCKGGVKLEIDKSERTLDVYSCMEGTVGRFIARYPIGLPISDSRKENGEYVIGKNKKKYEPKSTGEYGTLGSRRLALGRGAVDGPESSTSIHGTNRPEALAEDSPANSIRMRNTDVEELFMLLRVGTPVTIHD